MQIGQLGRRAGVAVKTIRYYEQIGLLPEPARTASGYRDYADEAVDRLRFIRDAQAAGLSLTEIASIVDMRDRGDQTCGHVIELLDTHLAVIDRQIAQLRITRRVLADMAEQARALDPGDCVDPHRCQTIAPGAVGGRSSDTNARHLHTTPSPHAHP